MQGIKQLLIRYLQSKIEPKAHTPWTEIKEGAWFGLGITFGLAVFVSAIYRILKLEEVQASDVALLNAGLLLIGVIVAFGSMRNNRLERSAKTYHEEAKDLFKAAYQSLEIDPDTNFPINSRQNYLNCARLLLSAQRLQSLIPLKADRDAAREIEQYWRFQFNELLLSRSKTDLGEEKRSSWNSGSNHPWSNRYYFFEKHHLLTQIPGERSPISLKSLAVIIRFMKWPDNLQNEIKKVTDLTYSEVEQMWFDPVSGLQEYISRVNSPNDYDDTTRTSRPDV